VKLRNVIVGLAAATAAFAQPGQPAPMQPTYSMQASNLKPALPGALEGIGIDQKLDQQVSLGLEFKDEFGRTTPLSTYFQGNKPVLLALVYYRCPMLCTQILNGVISSLKAVSLEPGKDFEVVSVSFDPKDTPELAASKKQMYMRRFARTDSANGFHFLTGDDANIKALTDQVGFHYRYDPATEQFAHASGIMILTPQGKLSRYFYGVEYAPIDVRLGLVEASHNKIGSVTDEALLFCYHYDPTTGKYGAVAVDFLRIAGVLFFVFGAGWMLMAWRRDLRMDRHTLRRAG